MRQHLCRYLLTAFVTVIVIVAAHPALAQDFVVARVGSVPISVFEVNRELQRLIPLAGTYHSGVKPEKIAELREQAVQNLIERAYLIQYAYDNDLAVSATDVDGVVKTIRSRFKTSEEFVAALGSESEKEFRASLERMFLAEKVLKVAVADRVNIDEKAMKVEFEKNRGKYKRPRQFRASHILIKVSPSLTAEEKQEKLKFAESLYEKAIAGEDFYDLAYHNSEDKTAMVGGDVGYFHLGQMDGDVEAAVVKMKVGEISKPIRTFYGYEIVKLVEDSPETQLTYEDMREKLIATERKAQSEKLKADLLEAMRAKYPVERLVKS